MADKSTLEVPGFCSYHHAKTFIRYLKTDGISVEQKANRNYSVEPYIKIRCAMMVKDKKASARYAIFWPTVSKIMIVK